MDRQDLLSYAKLPQQFRGPLRVEDLIFRSNREALGVRSRTDPASWPTDFVMTFIFGKVGTGKTKLAVELMLQMCRWHSMRPAYFLAGSLRFPWESELAKRSIAVLDDYMRFYEPLSAQGLAINGVLADRFHNGWPTIITSNLAKPSEIDDAAIVDRIGTGLIIEMLGESKRRQKTEVAR